MTLTIQDLWVAAERLAEMRGEDPASVFGEVGLNLERPLKRWEYW